MTALEIMQCPLCHSPTALLVSGPSTLPHVIKCERCGTFDSDEQFAVSWRDLQPLPKLSGLARTHSELGERLLITFDNYEDLQKRAPSSVMEKARALLRALVRKSPQLGSAVELKIDVDYPLGFCTDEEEFRCLIYALVELKWVTPPAHGYILKLTLSGWSNFDQLPRTDDTKKAFVAMSFSKEMTPTYEEGIKPAIKKAGFEPIRVDDIEHTKKIDDIIIVEIRESRFIVADFTGHRNGVYFEAGFALGLGLPVIWLCRKDDLTHMHFDIRQYNCIDWTDGNDLQERLFNRIRAIIGIKK